MKKQIQTITLN